MKKTITLIIFLFFAISANAQKEHLKFLGVSMNTDFSYFKTQLAKKGIYPDPNLNDGTPVLKSDHADIFFKGQYLGYNAFINVSYIKKSKIVDNVIVLIPVGDYKTAIRDINDLKLIIDAKFPNTRTVKNTDEEFSVINNLGIINIYLGNSLYSNKTDYTVYVKYLAF